MGQQWQVSKELHLDKFRYVFQNYFAELNNDDPKGRAELYDFFQKKVLPEFGDHGVLGIDSSQQKIFHVCFDCNIQLWNEIFDRVQAIGKNCHLNFDWRELKQFMKFSFIWMPPGGGIKPHVTQNMIAMAAFNIPLKGENIINFYARGNQKDPIGEKIESHQYFNPTFLNVNEYHSVKNDSTEDRLILKTHLTATPFEKALSSYHSPTPIQVFDFPHPGLNNIPAMPKITDNDGD